jgi:hypothetical protein
MNWGLAAFGQNGVSRLSFAREDELEAFIRADSHD